MGVVYKLKKEVLDFILEQKKVNPELSCRKFVDIIYQRFQLELSKSSVNTILKDAQISSPVGRRGSGDVRTKAAPLREKIVIPVIPGTHDIIPGKVSPKLRHVSPEPSMEPPPKPSPEPPPKPPEESPGPQASTAQPLKPQKVEEKNGILYDGMGCIFLKAAEWELSNTSILGKLFRKHIKEGGGADIDAAAETLLFMEPFGIKRVEDLSGYTQQGLWALNGMKTRIDADMLSGLIHSIDNLKELCLNFSVEIPSIFSELHYIKMLLEDGTAVWMDAQLTSVLLRDRSHLRDGTGLAFSSPMNKTMTTIAKQFFNNIPSAIFYSTSPPVSADAQPEEGKGQEVPFSKEFCTMVSAFENVAGKRIVKISVCDSQEQEIAYFDGIFYKKRIFIAGMWPWQAGFEHLLNGKDCADGRVSGVIDETGDKYCNIFNFKEIYASCKTQDDFDPVSLRVVFLQEPIEESPFIALITNASPEEMSCEEIVSSYLWRWPRQRQGKARDQPQRLEEGIDNISHLLPICYDVPSLIKNMFSMLTRFCERRYFCASNTVPDKNGEVIKNDISKIMSITYGISGNLCVHEKSIHVDLLISEKDYPYQEALELAIMRLNESAVYDPSGRRLTLSSVVSI